MERTVRTKQPEETDKGCKNFQLHCGFLLTYDSRDIPANAYRGTYLDFRGMMYTKFLGSDDNFYRLEIDYRQYKTVGNSAKLVSWHCSKQNVIRRCTPDTIYPDRNSF